MSKKQEKLYLKFVVLGKKIFIKVIVLNIKVQMKIDHIELDVLKPYNPSIIELLCLQLEYIWGRFLKRESLFMV